ncbi:MAG: glycogen/starch/alpha-glucan phosphorylase, partial [Vallitaleaceae bacterium]|nr:glycogen/starch/alpha-glucan phosphorylase [Vallitaleaceae bacterium]
MNRLNVTKETLKKAVLENIKIQFRKTIDQVSEAQVFQAVAYAVRDIIVDQWIETHKTYEEQDAKTVYYLSMEFLMGRALGNNIINLKVNDVVREVLDELGLDLNVVEDQEPDAGLGNGGLGRLAACFLDSLATLSYPAYGCGIRYRYGIFEQKIIDGFQIEKPDEWLKNGNPFEIRRDEYGVEIKFGGDVRVTKREDGREKFVQENYQSIRAVPYDIPIIGYNNNTVNTLRIWDAEAVQSFDLRSFDRGDYNKAVEQQNLAKTIVEVLYPNDNHYQGKELRLKQQYFFISATIQRAVKKFKQNHIEIKDLPSKVIFHINDTHPSLTIPELMRVLMDDEGLEWGEAWAIVQRTCAYTNH